MKSIFLFLLAAISYTVFAQDVKFDRALSEKLGADEYGMRYYVLAILKTGTNEITDKEARDKIFRGHMDNISRMAKEGKLVIAGPIKTNERNYRGIYIFNVKSIAEAEVLLKTDPAIGEKVMEAELYEWYGSAALPEYLPAHEKIRQKSP